MKNLKMFEQYEMEDESIDPDMVDKPEHDVDEKADPTEVSSKDTMRVDDIMKKAGGTWNAKAEQLTRQMANAITDGYKALRRGLAAQEEGFHKMAMIFLLRAGSLGVKH